MTEQPYKSINYSDPEETRTATNPYTGNPVEQSLYKYRAIDYYETGCGRKIFLQISLDNHNKQFYKNSWEQFVNSDFYLPGTEELTEREFLNRYTRILSDMTVHMLRDKSLTIWQQHLHFNRS
jgi:hypothetical protein